MSQKKVSTWRQALRVGALATTMVTGIAASATGCLNRPIERVEPRTTTTIVERLTQSSVDKIDLLLVIDNSRSMADKQEILNLAVPDLVNELINPNCVYEDGTDSPQQPASPLDDCPEAGTDREFDPILDIHIGILTSSIGSHGADACDISAMQSLLPSVDDKAHLINRSGTDPGDPTVPTYQDLGFLVWDPDSETPSHNPQGESDPANLIDNLTQMVAGAGEVGCGYEATLEAWYRFLVEPAPYETARWISGSEADIESFGNRHKSAIAEDIDGDPVFLAKSSWEVNYSEEKWPKLKFHRTKERGQTS